MRKPRTTVILMCLLFSTALISCPSAFAQGASSAKPATPPKSQTRTRYVVPTPKNVEERAGNIYQEQTDTGYPVVQYEITDINHKSLGEYLDAYDFTKGSVSTRPDLIFYWNKVNLPKAIVTAGYWRGVSEAQKLFPPDKESLERLKSATKDSVGYFMPVDNETPVFKYYFDDSGSVAAIFNRFDALLQLLKGYQSDPQANAPGGIDIETPAVDEAIYRLSSFVNRNRQHLPGLRFLRVVKADDTLPSPLPQQNLRKSTERIAAIRISAQNKASP